MDTSCPKEKRKRKGKEKRKRAQATGPTEDIATAETSPLAACSALLTSDSTHRGVLKKLNFSKTIFVPGLIMDVERGWEMGAQFENKNKKEIRKRKKKKEKDIFSF